MISEILFDDGNHKWVVLGRDPDRKSEVIDTNEYVIISNNQGMLLDPGGIEIFPQVLTEITKYVNTENIHTILASHQDPDIASSLAMWTDLCPHLKTYCSWIWTSFIAHFGMGTTLKLNPIPDEGMELAIGATSATVYVVPAHYCHSPGNFSCYDPKSGILFSGDIGAALLPSDFTGFYVKNFEKHIQYMEGFHKRWMPSKEALKQWVKRIRVIKPNMICPQHGAIFQGENVNKLLDWLDDLEVGIYNNGGENEDINRTVWMKWKK